MNKENEVVLLKDVNFAYDSATILENINLSIEERDFLAIIGPNGAGKSTLVKIILGLLKPQSGTVSVLGKTPEQSCQKIGYLPQGNFFDLSFPLSVKEVVLYGLIRKNSFLPFFTKSEKVKVNRLMKDLNIYEYRNEKIGNLSGGQRQRVFIARALIANPRILILDEPNTHIDSQAEKALYRWLKELNKKITIVMISHDISTVSNLANKVACVNKNISVNRVDAILEDGCYHKHNFGSDDFVPIKHSCKL